MAPASRRRPARAAARRPPAIRRGGGSTGGRLDLSARLRAFRETLRQRIERRGTLLDVVRWTVQVAGVALPDAVRAATLTPATALGLPVGDVGPGGRADVLVVDDALAPLAVLRGGRWVEG